jgi:hypothetical protein
VIVFVVGSENNWNSPPRNEKVLVSLGQFKGSLSLRRRSIVRKAVPLSVIKARVKSSQRKNDGGINDSDIENLLKFHRDVERFDVGRPSTAPYVLRLIFTWT